MKAQRKTPQQKLDFAINFLRTQLTKGELPSEQRSYARLAIDFAEGNVGGSVGEVKAAKAWILSNIRLPKR